MIALLSLRHHQSLSEYGESSIDCRCSLLVLPSERRRGSGEDAGRLCFILAEDVDVLLPENTESYTAYKIGHLVPC